MVIPNCLVVGSKRAGSDIPKLRLEIHPDRDAVLAYTDFTLETAESLLGIRARVGDLFTGLVPSDVPDWLRDFLERGRQLALVSEKARSEFIVGPILLACRELSGGTLAIFSGQRLDVDASRGLVGECDFLLALSEPLPRLRAPIVAMVEAKKNDIEAGLGQCVAQMVAARDYNERDASKDRILHGCVTTGEAWQFLQLEGSSVTIDRTRIYIDNVAGILSHFQAIVVSHQQSN
jgi:hypothetical protein